MVAVLGAFRGGSAVRLEMTVEALSRLADVHLFVVGNESEPGPVPGAGHAARIGTACRRRPTPPVQAVRWLGRPGLPGHLARLDLGPAADLLHDFGPSTPDLTWLCKADAWLLARAAGVPGPTVCDLDDLDDVRLRSIDALHVSGPHGPPELAGVRGWPRRRVGLVDARRWAAFRARAAAGAVPVLCSAAERARSGLADAMIVPNGYPADADDAAWSLPPTASAPTAVFVGAFDYLPNLDAARWVARDIAPALQRLDPAATVRLVGPGPPELHRLSGTRGVSWTGEVADPRPHLRAASVALVPLRAGSGTRVKILEAWAHGVPVVSTVLGAEGLDATDGDDLLLADDAPALAEAILRVTSDAALGRRLAEAGRRRWLAAHSPDAVSDAVASVVRRALQGADRS